MGQYRREAEPREDVRLIKQPEAVKKSQERLKLNIERPWGLSGHDTGIHPLNLMIGGWIPGKVTVIAGRSGSGKTATSVPMFQAGARIQNGRRAEYLFFTWEMAASYLVDRHVCNRVGITNRLLTQGAKLLTKQHMKLVGDAYKEAFGLPVTYQQNSLNINVVKSIVMKFVQECKEKEQVEGVSILPVILIDYIGMAQFEKFGLRTYGIAEFMNGLKSLANSTGGAFCVYAQINRSADDKDLPTRSDLSDSQSIEMASDNLIIMHRPEYNSNPTIKLPGDTLEYDSKHKALFLGVKGRDMGTSNVLLHADVRYNRFWDLDHQYNTEYWKLYESEDYWKSYFNIH